VVGVARKEGAARPARGCVLTPRAMPSSTAAAPSSVESHAVSRLSGGRTTAQIGAAKHMQPTPGYPGLTCCEKYAPRTWKSAKAGWTHACAYSATPLLQNSTTLTCMAQAGRPLPRCMRACDLLVRTCTAHSGQVASACHLRATSVSYVLARAHRSVRRARPAA
jgi:hypothetical protein